ncbi:MAG: cell division protein FtsQ/DivIB [Planctomycetes bacterium]|nr:cell division protein FtsQ/DivIB [Planctomycetota bacterium]MCH9725429.1 cell division protein FtsQ/DivIB [Planctomycetota bacterium]MCH9776526.1 cell division protein FtsQ/DivIB [Planctomycetota bacterium]MCH9790773.1 cell division protein FtsQ/DivIB [Planctomycetota bacterium]MDF1742300.1 cell division protein FtsQ/DivIB [Gimesia sp.]
MSRKASKKRPVKKKVEEIEEEEEELEEEESVLSPSFLLHMLFRPKVLLILAICASGLFFFQKLKNQLPDLTQRKEYQIETKNLSLNPAPPHYVPIDIVDQVIKRSQLPEKVSLLDQALVLKIAEAFQNHPWVQKVVSVQKTNTVVVEVLFRKPAAMVELKQNLYPVDNEGILLPSEDFSVSDARRYPIITGIRSVPEGSAGSPWGDLTVKGAAQLAEALGPYWKELDIVSIEAPRRTTAKLVLDDLIYRLITTGGSEIVWGRSPKSQRRGELRVEQKIGKLEKYYRDYGGFDRPHGPYEIDIRHWQEISRRPLKQQSRQRSLIRR